MSTIQLAKLHATGNDFLVWSRLDADSRIPTVRRRIRARRRPRSATATAASAPTA